MIIYVTEAKEIEQEALDLLTESGHELVVDEAMAKAHAAEVEALFIRTYTQATAEYLAAYPNLKFVLRAGVGLDNVDVEECKRRAIKVINAPGANANAVAEYVVGAIIVSLRQFAAQEASLRKGEWRTPAHMGQELKGRTLGLVGCGNVGRAIAHKLSSWELKEVIGYDPFLTAEQLAASGIRKCELDEVIAGADILSLHVPLIKETKHLINAEKLAQTKKGALLINAARGGVVDEAALLAALTSGQLMGAVLDVLETEPTVHPGLAAAQNLILTPHIAGYTHEANKEVSLAPARELLRQLASVS